MNSTPDPQTDRSHRTVLAVTVTSRPDGGHYFNQADFTAHVAQWLKTDLKGHHAIDQVTVDDQAAAPVAAPPTGQTALRDRIAGLFRHPPGVERLGDATPGEIADAVLSVLPADSEPHRLALSTALGLGTSAPWDAIRERAAELAGQGVAEDDEGDELVCVDECGSCDACGMEPFGTPAEGWRKAARFLRRTARTSGNREGALHGARLIETELRRLAAETPGPETQGEAHPPRHTWEVESPRRDNWASWGVTYDERDWARERYESAIGNAPARPFRLVRATTTYSVEAEHTPATEPQDAPRREPHPAEADLRHALTVLDRFQGRDTSAPAAFEADLASKTSPKAGSKPEIVHGCPPDGSGLTPCCGRTPFELPLGDRISSEAPITCATAPAVVAEPGKEA